MQLQELGKPHHFFIELHSYGETPFFLVVRNEDSLDQKRFASVHDNTD